MKVTQIIIIIFLLSNLSQIKAIVNINLLRCLGSKASRFLIIVSDLTNTQNRSLKFFQYKLNYSAYRPAGV